MISIKYINVKENIIVGNNLYKRNVQCKVEVVCCELSGAKFRFVEHNLYNNKLLIIVCLKIASFGNRLRLSPRVAVLTFMLH